MPPPAFIHNLVRCSRNLGWNSVRSLAYTTRSTVSHSSSADTNVLCQPLGKFKVIETLDQLKRERCFALLKKFGFKDSYRSRVLPKDAIDNTDWEIESFEISDKLFDALMEEKQINAVEMLVEVYASAGRFQEAMHALSEMKRRSGLVASTRTFNFVLDELIIKRKKGDMIESIFNQLKGNGLIPNVHTYGMLIRGHCLNGCLKEAWGVFEQMEEAGVEPTPLLYSVYIHGLCLKGETDLAFRVVKNLRDSNKPIDAHAYAFVIFGFVNKSRLQDAEDVLVDMKLREVAPNAQCYEALIRGYCDQKGDIYKALVLCKEMESRGIEIIDHLTLRSMMECLWDLDMLAEALYVFKHFEKQSRQLDFPDMASFEIAYDAACDLELMDDAMELLEEMAEMHMDASMGLC